MCFEAVRQPLTRILYGQLSLQSKTEWSDAISCRQEFTEKETVIKNSGGLEGNQDLSRPRQRRATIEGAVIQ